VVDCSLIAVVDNPLSVIKLKVFTSVVHTEKNMIGKMTLIMVTLQLLHNFWNNLIEIVDGYRKGNKFAPMFDEISQRTYFESQERDM